MMRAPSWWWEARPGVKARLWQPFSLLWGGWASFHMHQEPTYRTSLPVVCLGNFVIGGTGKTPLILDFAKKYQREGKNPFVLSRGYGGRLSGAHSLRVDPLRHHARDVGDEPLFLARHVPVIIGKNRGASARLAMAQGADMLLLDDGLQNNSLGKDITYAVVDADLGVGNALCLPAGPLRAPLSTQWPKVNAVILMHPLEGEGLRAVDMRERAALQHVPLFNAHLAPDPEHLAHLRGQKIMAFAGIGHPAKFFKMLELAGCFLVAHHAFPDHHPFTSDELSLLRAKAQSLGARLVTTEKDAIRLQKGTAFNQGDIETIPVHVVWRGEAPKDFMHNRQEIPNKHDDTISP